VALYGRSLRSFIVAGDDVDMPVSCARRLSDFCGVCSNLAPISSSIVHQTRSVFSIFLIRKWRSRPDVLRSSWMKMTAFWDVVLLSLVEVRRRFRGRSC
jgi:hypothetical protein